MKYHLVLRKRKGDSPTKKLPVYLRVRVDEFKTPLKIYVQEKHWSKEHETVLPSCPDYDQLSGYFIWFKNKINELIVSHKPKTGRELVYLLHNKNNSIKLTNYALRIADKLERQNRFGNASVYRQLSSSLNKAFKHDMPSIKSVTRQTVNHYEDVLIENGLKLSSRRTYLSTLRALMNKAVEEELIEPYNQNLFKGRIKAGKPNHRATSSAKIGAIRELEFVEYSALDRSRDWFILMFNLQGMNFIDIAHIPSDIIEKTSYRYVRRKMQSRDGEEITVSITKEAKTIFKKYEGRSDYGYALPIIKAAVDSSKAAFVNYKTAARNNLRELNKIGKMIGLESVTTYVARHSWATIADQLNVDRRRIQEMMGHSNMKTTEGYIERLKEVDNIDITELISQGGVKKN